MLTPLLLPCPVAGDHTVIAKETCRMLGLGTNIANAKGLPLLEGGGKVPDDLGKKYGQMILEADGFAEVRGGQSSPAGAAWLASAAVPWSALLGCRGQSCSCCRLLRC